MSYDHPTITRSCKNEGRIASVQLQESRVRVSSPPSFRLDLRSATVNEEFDACDETGVIGSEK